jgi:hypothetical protein
MKIETKFNIGDEVWFKRKSDYFKGRISAIHASLRTCETIPTIEYNVIWGNDFYHDYIIERNLYRTKEELLKSL